MVNILKRWSAPDKGDVPRSEGGGTVAIVSPESGLLKQSAHALKGICSSLRFASLEDAFKKLPERCPDLLLVDYRATNQRSLAELKNHPVYSQVPCVFLVGTEGQRTEIGQAFGSCGFLALPLDRQELKNRLTHLIHIRQEGAKYLTRSSKKTKFLEEGANVGTWEWDPTSDVVEASDALRALLGDAVVGQARSLSSWLDSVQSDDRERLESSYAALRSGEVDSHQIEYRVVGDGQVRWVQERARVLEWKNGVPSRVFAIVANDTARRASERRIVQLVNYDTLTSLPNRNKCTQALSEALELSSVRPDASCFFRVDVSGLSRINETRGREAGNEVLRQVGERLKSFVSPHGLVGRFEGKEFALIRHGLSANQVEVDIRALASDIEEELERPYVLEGESVVCHPQMGACVIDESASDAEELIRHAEIALHQSLNTSRPFALFHPDMMWEVEERTRFQKDFERAVFTNEFQLAYQPIVDADGKVYGVEGLARWQHPARGLVPAPDFIGAAEETGLIVPLGVRLRRQACEQLVRWSREPSTAHLTVSVNVSPAEFRSRSFVRDLLVLVRGLRIPRNRLYLELTESILVGDIREVGAAMEELREAGVGLVLDDFGTGYSSLSYLRTLPFNRLKVDRSFVKNILESPRDSGLAKTILAMAENLQLEAVVEGVEHEAQLHHLVKMGCDRFQGFHFARPGSVQATEALIRR